MYAINYRIFTYILVEAQVHIHNIIDKVNEKEGVSSKKVSVATKISRMQLFIYSGTPLSHFLDPALGNKYERYKIQKSFQNW